MHLWLDITNYYNIIISCRNLQETFPCFANEHSFLMFIMSSTNFYDESGAYYVLYQFLLDRPKLYNCINVLPDMVDFYQWFHWQFPNCFKKKESEVITIGEVLKKSENYSHVGFTPEIGEKRWHQYARLCGMRFQ